MSTEPKITVRYSLEIHFWIACLWVLTIAVYVALPACVAASVIYLSYALLTCGLVAAP